MILRFNRYLIIALLVFSVACTEKKKSEFSFIQLSDTQLGFGPEDYASDCENFKQAVIKINELNPDFVVICGDLVHTPSDSSFSDFKKIIEDLKMPCYYAPGNHDVGNIPNDTTLAYYRNTLGKDYYEFHHKGHSFIMTNTSLWKANVEDESEEYDSWFMQTVKKQGANNYPIIVIGHHPIYLKMPDEEEAYFNLPLTKRQELLSLFKQNNVVAYLSGHTHELTINNYENIQLVSSETTSNNFDKRPFGFRVWQVSSDTLKHHFETIYP